MSTSTISDSEVQEMAGGRWATWLASVLHRGIAVYVNWRTERRAATILSFMSEEMLKDIGLSRSQISYAVRVSRSPGEPADEPHRSLETVSPRPCVSPANSSLWTWSD